MSTNKQNLPILRLVSRAAAMMRSAKVTPPTARSGRMLITLLMMLLTTATAWAKSGPAIDLSTVHADFTAQDGDVLTGTLGDFAKITIADGATVTLSDVTIKNLNDYPSTDREHLWAGLTCLGDATIVLEGTNYVGTIGGNYSAIYVPVDYTLTIQGDGALTASVEDVNAAGIGGGVERPCGNIVIAGGTITAVGFDDGAGIGGGYQADCGTITITTGVKKVTAINIIGNNPSRSIGAGYEGTCGTVTIGCTLDSEGHPVGGTVYPDGIATSPYTYPQVNYTVCFNANGGSGTMASMAFTTNVAQSLTANAFTAPEGGYIFTGWNTAADGSGTFFTDGQSVQDLTDDPGGTVTLYALWFKDDLSTMGNMDVVIPDGTTLTGTLRTDAKVSIADGATVTLNGVTIRNNHYREAGLTCLGDATIVLADGSVNAVTGGPGIYVPEGNTLTISGGSLGTGSITALGLGESAGIGSSGNASCGNITISGGTVTATGDNYAAGIGSGDCGSCGAITISGGTITAKRGRYAPNSLGAGDRGSCGTVTIDGVETGSIATETFVYPAVTYSVSFDANGGTGTIGDVSLASNVELTLPTNGFTAPEGKTFVGWNTAADGSGTPYADGQTVVNLTSTGGTVTLYAQWFDGDLSVLKTDFVVPDGLTLRGTLQADVKVAIADGATVTLNGVTINGADDNNMLYWDGLTCLGDANIVVADGSTNTVKPFDSSYAGIFVPEDKTLTISGGPLGTGSLSATSPAGVGIGSHVQARAGNIVITGGNITASSTGLGGCNPGIGGECGDITISGGTVTATGGKQGGVGIGSDSFEKCGNITISGGTVTATGGGGQAGIGNNSWYGECGDITLSGGTITASSYNGTVRIASDRYFKDGNGNWYTAGTLSDEQKSALAGQTLQNCTKLEYTLSLFGTGNDGSASKPYVISSDAGWNAFCDALEDEDLYSLFNNKAIKLGADIGSEDAVYNMAGTSEHPFSGTFDGDGHTLNFFNNVYFNAPFAYVSGATIQNLHVTGWIYTSYNYAAGIVGHTTGSTTITNCRSSIEITSNWSGDSHGGLVGYNEGSLTIDGCLFDGKLLNDPITITRGGCAGFVGWNTATVSISNSIYAPAAVGGGEEWAGTKNSATFVRNDDGATATISNCYYTTDFNDGTNYTGQGKQTHSITAGNGVTIGIVGTATEYATSGITLYEGTNALKLGSTFYACYDDEVPLTLSHGAAPEGYVLGGYTANERELYGNDTDGYTLYMPDEDVTINATWFKDIKTCTATVPNPVYHGNFEHVYFYDGTWNANHGGVTVYDPDGNLLTYGTDYSISLFDKTQAEKGNDWQELGDECVVTIAGCGEWAGQLTADVVIENVSGNGTWGDNLAWSFEEGTLTITGSGAMKAAANNEGYPWYEYGSYINTIILDDRITTIAPAAFGGTQNVNIYGGVKAIARRYQDEYSSEQDEYGQLPTKLESIGDHAFAYCTALSVNIDDVLENTKVTLANIGTDAFNQVGSITGTLRNSGDNTAMLDLMAAAAKANVTLSGRTLIKDGDWNTLCLPFSLDADAIAASPLAEATIMKLDVEGYYNAAGQRYPYYDASFTNTGFDAATGTLTLYFQQVTAIEDGTPYLIKWTTTGDPITNLTFNEVKTINTPKASVSEDQKVRFQGTFSTVALPIDDKSNLFLGEENTLYYPNGSNAQPADDSFYLDAFRAYFHVGTMTAVRAFKLNFGDGSSETSSLNDKGKMINDKETGAWYTLNGVKLDKKPTRNGLYIHNGRKVVIK